MTTSLPLSADPVALASEPELDADASASLLAGFLQRHDNVLVLTGAGLSTASGIPDYRDQDGVRRGRAPVQGPEFRANDAVRRRYWARSMVGWPTLAQAAPNQGHRALAELEAAGRVTALITQNVDGLHQRAGTRRLNELHGNIHHVVCLDCGAQFARSLIQQILVETNPQLARAVAQPLPDGDAQLEPEALDEFVRPHCLHCGGTLQPDVVFFGDNIPAPRTAEALQWMADADALLVVGSSLMVFSGYRFCKLAAEAGKPIAAVNMGKTRADHLIGLKIAASAQDILPRLL